MPVLLPSPVMRPMRLVPLFLSCALVSSAVPALAKRAPVPSKTVAARSGVTPLRPFVGADLVWAVQGDAVLGPQSASAVEKFLSGPPDLPAGCALGDISLHPTTIDMGVRCKDGQKVVVATLLAQPTRLNLELWAEAPETYEPLRAELTHRLNDHIDEIPLEHARLSAAPGGAAVPEPQAAWLRVASALQANDLPAAQTAVTAAVAVGPGALPAQNRLDAAILWMGAHRAQGGTVESLRKPLQSWLAPLQKPGTPDATLLAARVLLGQGGDVVGRSVVCAAPLAEQTPCDVLPIVRALVAVGRAKDAAAVQAAHVKGAQAQGAPPHVEDVRLATGLAEWADDSAVFQEMAQAWLKLRPEDGLAWLSLSLALTRAEKWDAALHTLLEMPTNVAPMPEMLESTLTLADVLWDPSQPASADVRAGLVAFADPPQTAARRLFLLLADGFHGRLSGLDAGLQTVGATVQGQPQAALLAALRARVALAAHRLGDARGLLAPLVAAHPDEPQVVCAWLDVLLQETTTGDEAIALAQTACLNAENKRNRPGRNGRVERMLLAVQIHAWGLQPPLRWPFAPSLGDAPVP